MANFFLFLRIWLKKYSLFVLSYQFRQKKRPCALLISSALEAFIRVLSEPSRKRVYSPPGQRFQFQHLISHSLSVESNEIFMILTNNAFSNDFGVMKVYMEELDSYIFNFLDKRVIPL